MDGSNRFPICKSISVSAEAPIKNMKKYDWTMFAIWEDGRGLRCGAFLEISVSI